MAEPFDVCWERIARANTHSEAIARTWNTFIEEESYAAHVEVNDDGAGCLWIEQVIPIPASIALEIGELLYQFRAALDACVYETACVNSGQRPPPDENKLEFPICLGVKEFTKSSWKIEPLTPKQRAIVEAVQPYNTPTGLTPKESCFSFNRGLGILNDWARKDRHRKLHVIGSWAANIQPMLVYPAGTRIVDFTVLRETFMLKDECKVARFCVEGWKRGMNLKANPNLTLDIAVDEIPLPCHNIDTLQQRVRCIQYGVGTVVHSMGVTVGIDRTN